VINVCSDLLFGTQQHTIMSTGRFFDTVLVRPPSATYINCVSTNPARGSIDLALARDQHKEYVSILRESVVNVIELPPSDKFPDSVFMQDPALLGSCQSMIGRLCEKSRQGEESALCEDLHRLHLEVGNLYFTSRPGTLEGGDILVTEDRVYVGASQRTNREGIAQLATCLSSFDVKPIKTGLMHLLCGCSYLSDGTIIISPELVSPKSFPGLRFVMIPREEAYAADALYLGEKRVLIPLGFPKTSSKLREAGYEPVEVEVSEFRKGDGGVTCLCSPIYTLF
jgi:dimethylargininase